MLRLLSLALFLAAPAAAQISVPAGYSVLECDAGGQPTGLELTPPDSPWGENVYFTTFQGELRVVDPFLSGATMLVAGLPAATAGASSLLFDDRWGSDDFLLTMESSTIVRIDPALNATVWATGFAIIAPNDLIFPPQGGSFGVRLFVANGFLTWGEVGRVGQGAGSTPWASTPGASTCGGMAFPTPGAGFPDVLFVADQYNDRLFAYAPDTTLTLYPGIVDPVDVAAGPGGAFGTDLYVSTTAGTIERMNSAGVFTTFASGLSIDSDGWSGDLVFQPDGEALWVATEDAIVRIGFGPGQPFCYGNGTVSCPCGNDGAADARGGCVSSLGVGGKLESLGTASVAADDLGLVATQLPPNQFGVLFAGDQTVPGVPIGDGLRCVGGNLIRLGLSPTGTGGVGSWLGGLGALGGWTAGDSRSFQVWYRDPIGSPCGSNFNVTNALFVTLVP